jgi:hypothetical protein
MPRSRAVRGLGYPTISAIGFARAHQRVPQISRLSRLESARERQKPAIGTQPPRPNQFQNCHPERSGGPAFARTIRELSRLQVWTTHVLVSSHVSRLWPLAQRATKAMAAKLHRLVYRMLRYGMKYVDQCRPRRRVIGGPTPQTAGHPSQSKSRRARAGNRRSGCRDLKLRPGVSEGGLPGEIYQQLSLRL